MHRLKLKGLPNMTGKTIHQTSLLYYKTKGKMLIRYRQSFTIKTTTTKKCWFVLIEIRTGIPECDLITQRKASLIRNAWTQECLLYFKYKVLITCQFQSCSLAKIIKISTQ